jgi:ABC-type nitrate/sulfonate/bicarbonate transport system ATPase subunit
MDFWNRSSAKSSAGGRHRDEPFAYKDVRHSYALTEVLGGVGLALSPGRVLALVGPSGCGKTTLLHLCAGLLDVQEGRLDNAFANPALMFQQPRLLPWQTTADNIALGLRAQGMARAAARERAHAMGAVLGLDLEPWPPTRTSSRAACKAAPRWRARWCWSPTCC